MILTLECILSRSVNFNFPWWTSDYFPELHTYWEDLQWRQCVIKYKIFKLYGVYTSLISNRLKFNHNSKRFPHYREIFPNSLYHFINKWEARSKTSLNFQLLCFKYSLYWLVVFAFFFTLILHVIKWLWYFAVKHHVSKKQHNFVFLLFYLQKIKCIVSVHYVISEWKKFSTNVQQTLHKKR